MTTTPILTQWKRDARRIKELLETAQALADFDRPPQTADAISCLQRVKTILETWQHNTQAELATMNYKADEQRRNTTTENYRAQCPSCQQHYPTYLFRPVHHDVMGDPRTTLIVCPKCERNALTNTETENQ